MKKIVILIIIIIIGVVGYLVFSNKPEKKQTNRKVKSVPVKRDSILVKIEETGTIQPKREVEIKSEISGKVQKFFVDEGDFVSEGDLIAEIIPDYNQAKTITNVKSNLKLARIRLKNAEKDYEKRKDLYEKEYISQDELDQAKDSYEEAKINYQSALQTYESIEDIDTESEVNKIIASSEGTVIQRLVEEGEKVVSSAGNFSEGTSILKLADLSQMIVESSINEVDISKIYENQKVEIQVDAFPYKKYHGKIVKIAAMAVQQNNVKVFPFEIKILNKNTKLRPGMTANVTIIGEKRKNIITVPIRALFSNQDNEDIVYTVENDTISGEKLVKTGINDYQKVEIIKGLKDNQKVSLEEPVSKKPQKGFRK